MAISTGVGTQLWRGQTVPPPAPGLDTFLRVGRVLQITGPQISKEKVEVPDLGNESGYKEFLSGLRDPGTCQLKMAKDPANVQQTGIRNDLSLSTALSQRNYRIIWPNGLQADFVAEAFEGNFDTQANSPNAFDVTLQISGAVTFT